MLYCLLCHWYSHCFLLYDATGSQFMDLHYPTIGPFWFLLGHIYGSGQVLTLLPHYYYYLLGSFIILLLYLTLPRII